MIALTDTVSIDAPPETVFGWLRDLEGNYTAWHPDHVKWVLEGGFREGSLCYFEERIHGKLHKFRGRITRLEENRRVEFRFFFPSSLVCPGGSFLTEPKGDGTAFTATLSFRLGRFFSTFAKRRVDAIRVHMKEEGENLKAILEGGGGIAPR